MPLQPEQLHLNFYLGINFGKEKKPRTLLLKCFSWRRVWVWALCIWKLSVLSAQFVVNLKLLYKMQINDFLKKILKSLKQEDCRLEQLKSCEQLMTSKGYSVASPR